MMTIFDKADRYFYLVTIKILFSIITCLFLITLGRYYYISHFCKLNIFQIDALIKIKQNINNNI